MFGKKKASAAQGGTVLILDIESGSVATALVDMSKAQPQIMYAHREHLPLLPSRSGSTIANALEKSLAHTLQRASEIAARMRLHSTEQPLGHVARVAVFLAAPWGSPDLVKGNSKFVPGIREYIKEKVEASFGTAPVSFYTSADALTHNHKVTGGGSDTVAVALRGELLELLFLSNDMVRAYTTVPLGSRSILRTLQTHGALSEHEARSMLRLQKHTSNAQYEPLQAASKHLSDAFVDSAALVLPLKSNATILIVAEQPMGEWFAKSIADNSRVLTVFVPESTVEAFLPYHVADHVGQSGVEDPFILTETLFLKKGDTFGVY